MSGQRPKSKAKKVPKGWLECLEEDGHPPDAVFWRGIDVGVLRIHKRQGGGWRVSLSSREEGAAQSIADAVRLGDAVAKREALSFSGASFRQARARLVCVFDDLANCLGAGAAHEALDHARVLLGLASDAACVALMEGKEVPRVGVHPPTGAPGGWGVMEVTEDCPSCPHAPHGEEACGAPVEMDEELRFVERACACRGGAPGRESLLDRMDRVKREQGGR